MLAKEEIIAMACDHAGFELKTGLMARLQEWGYQVHDFGAFSSESVDYPDMAHPLAAAVNDGTFQQGILICGSGNGVAMVANKYPRVRAALCWNTEIAELARKHNNANILALPGRYVSLEEAASMTKAFLTTDFEGGRHERRVNKISGHQTC